MNDHRRPAGTRPRPQDRGDHPGRSGRRAVGPRRDHRVRRHRQHPGPVPPAAQGHRRGPVRAARGHRRLGLGLLRLGQKFVRQEPRLRPPEPHGPRAARSPTCSSSRSTTRGSATCSTSSTPRIPTEVILFEVAKERDTRKVTERIAELMYTVLLRELDYAEDFDIAELEIELEAEGKLDEFVATCKKLHKQDWRMVRKGAQKLSRASAVLHDLDPKHLSVGRLVVARPAEPGRRDHRQQGRRADLRACGPTAAGQGARLHHRRGGPARRPQRRQDRRPAGHRRGVRQGRQEPAEGAQDRRPVLDRRHLAGEARRGGRRHRLEAGRTGQAAGPLPLPGRPRPLRHPGGRHQAGAGQEARRPSRR